MHQPVGQEKSKPLTYEQIRDIVLDKQQSVKNIKISKRKTVSQKPSKKNHNFEFV